MTSSKRDFVNFEAFPGSFTVVNKNTVYEFPEIIYSDLSNRKRTWKIFIRLIKEVKDEDKINWTLEPNSSIKITNTHYKKIEDPNIVSQIWTEQGIFNLPPSKNDKNGRNSKVVKYKLTRSVPTYIKKGKNIGKINETNVFTQALINARSKYLKHVDKYSARDQTRIFPVAVHKYEASPKDLKKHITYPCLVQRKLDGGRSVSYFEKDYGVVLYTRKLKDLSGNGHIIAELNLLYNIINNMYPGAYLDGEIYKHGLSLQQISGIMRRESQSDKETTQSHMLEYHVFDIFFPFIKERMGMPLIKRLSLLNDIFMKYKTRNGGGPLKYIKLVDSFTAETAEEETGFYNQFLEEKYEGSIVKNMNAPYEFGMRREIRTYQMRKRKPRYSAEFEIVGFTEGRQGKDKKAIIFIMKTKEKDNVESVQFNAAPVGIDYKERYKMFKDMTGEKFKKYYLGKMMTVEYDDISEDGVPLRAKAKVVRYDDVGF